MIKLYKFGSSFLFLVLFSISLVGYAQTTISGSVKEVTGEPLPGVSIKVKGGSNKSTVTSVSGDFSIKVLPTDKVLVFSFIGFKTQEVNIGNNTLINVILQESANRLDEVIVTGYTATARKDLTGSVGTVDIKDLQKAPVASFEEALAGRVAGVQVSSQSGRPGSSIDIVIRGVGSISQSNKPLFVIDGFPLENPSNDLIDPNNIESIDVLKDASATALYGARGSNGVVVITTKKGSAGAAKVNYNGYYGINSPVKYLKLLSPYQFVQAQAELGAITGNGTPYLSDGRTLDDYRDVKGVDFQAGLLRTAGQQNQSLSIAGGNNGTQYSFSGNYFSQEGIIVNSSFERYQFRMTLDQTLGKKFKVGGNATLTSSLTKGDDPQANGGPSSVFNRVFTYRPISQGGKDESLIGELYDPDISDVNVLGNYLSNPVINQLNVIRDTRNANIYANTYVDYKITPHLKFTAKGYISTTFRRYGYFNGSNTASGGFYSTSGINGGLYNYEYDYLGQSNILNYTNTFNKKHNVSLVAATDLLLSQSNVSGYNSRQIPDESLGLSGLDAGEVSIPTSLSISKSTMSSFIGSFSYNYMGKYYFTSNIRADGSSKFVNDNKWGYFPSASVKWRFSKENFFKDSKWLSDGGLRMSYGVTGNNRVGDFDTYARINFTDPLVLNGVTQPLSAVISSLQNPLLRWEKTASSNIGLDLGFLNDKINLTVDIYNRTTKDLLYRTPLPYSTGFTSAIKNIASIRNQGIEFTLGAKVVNNKTFSYSTSFNTSLNRNRLVELSDPTETAILTSVGWEALYGSIPSFIAKVGGPLGQMYGLVSDGLYQYTDFDKLPNGTFTLKPNVPSSRFSSAGKAQPGDNKFKDINNDGVIDDDDKVVIGNGYPLLYGGWSNNFRYKNFDASIFLQWSYGNDILNANRIWFSNGLGIATRYSFIPAQNAFAEYADRWTPTNQNTDIPRMNRASQVIASQFVEDGSFIRLKTLNIGYTLPSNVLSKIKIDRLRIYVSAQNLFTLSRYKGYDPELSAFQTALTPGVDYSTYPRPFTVTAGINLTL